jgi:hypothetical protein
VVDTDFDGFADGVLCAGSTLQVGAVVERQPFRSSRSSIPRRCVAIDELLGDLIEPTSGVDLPAGATASHPEVLSSKTFTRLVAAFTPTLSGRPVPVADPPAARVIDVIAQRSLRQEERGVFEGEGANEATRLWWRFRR